MARAALQGRTGPIGREPRKTIHVIPAASVVIGSLCALMPVVSTTGWAPDIGFLMLIAWRLLRADAWPTWWAAPLGLANDLIVGTPVGQSIALWSGVMLILDLADRRTMWRDYWIEWLLATLLILLGALFAWRVAGWGGAPVPFIAALPAIALSVAAFPIASGLVSRLDRWRLRQ